MDMGIISKADQIAFVCEETEKFRERERERVKRRCCDNDPTLIFIKHSASATTCSIYDRSHMNKVNKLVTCDHDPNIIPITANLTAFTADIKTRYTTPELQYLINFSLSSSLKTLLFLD
ncbi:Bifunctional inhibitor/lipid-transfer protein/seed storage 2S albumin superfamily protein [Theobroma cacao]|uniref:Bifunctional inhibitor/lipid-transfer protein/seed storage 2S albumin superfamily protein n=1 Tax=Theobroma cacao TaxID=3641 RepID=A0A061FUB4_THECC|nr:Bifunctional inhibitor/lipid-transfer protein/seed storage 2S albumin superfamily protein [Theobroma cacao]